MADFRGDCDTIANYFRELGEMADRVEQIRDCCVETLRKRGKILFCGNGGSASQSQHLAAELVGRYKKNRPAMNSVALTVDTSILTAVANDYGYETVFRRQVEGIGQNGDVLIGLSTSGNSLNVVRAFEAAKDRGIKTIALTGKNPGKMGELADLVLAVPAEVSNHIQELHLAIGHWICGEVERCFYGE